jgi:hypothetical protein
MAKSKNNVLTHGLSGKIGDLIVFKQRDGKTYVSAAPRKAERESEKQKEHRNRFRKAASYAKEAQYEDNYLAVATQKGKPAYNLAIADFFNAPNIEKVDVSNYSGKAGDVILITVIDDFAVKAVTVRIIDNEGVLIEESSAVQSELDYEWVFTAQQNTDNLSGYKLEVLASDIPHNLSIYEYSF